LTPDPYFDGLLLRIGLGSIRTLRLTCTAVFVLSVASATAQSQPNVSLKKELVWSLSDNEIASPQFSPDGSLIVLVTRVHWPDGDEAEGLPESVFEKLEQRKQREPRFADPIVRVVDLKGNVVCEARYGTNPSIAADNKSIVFSRQLKPLTGMRTLAETQAGNDIQLFDCEKKQTRTIAKPPTGYFDSPIFLPDGHSVAYTANEAVNGAMGGSVGIERVEMNGGQPDSLLTRESKAAVSCPTDGSAKLTGFQTMMCSQGKTNLSSSFPTLIENFTMAGDELLVLRAKPMPTAGDMYLASHYELSLVSMFPKNDEIFSMGQADMNKLWSTAFEPVGKDELMIFTEFWKPFSVETKSWLVETAPRNSNRRSEYSPNGEYYLAFEPAGDEPSHFTLYRTEDGQKLFTSPKLANLFDLAWSRDSSRFAVVALPNGIPAQAYREVLSVYTLQ
jgi:dipeptidyl aminopeptidase/acylaminoacyl peptidase